MPRRAILVLTLLAFVLGFVSVRAAEPSWAIASYSPDGVTCTPCHATTPAPEPKSPQVSKPSAPPATPGATKTPSVPQPKPLPGGVKATLNIDGQTRTVEGVNVRGRMLIPAEIIPDLLGSELVSETGKNSVAFKHQSITVEFVAGKKTFTLNGREKNLDVAPTIMNGHLLIPLRTLVEAVGGQVQWSKGNVIAILGVPRASGSVAGKSWFKTSRGYIYTDAGQGTGPVPVQTSSGVIYMDIGKGIGMFPVQTSSGLLYLQKSN